MLKTERDCVWKPFQYCGTCNPDPITLFSKTASSLPENHSERITIAKSFFGAVINKYKLSVGPLFKLHSLISRELMVKMKSQFSNLSSVSVLFEYY